ncbi:OLC1v1024403C1 [Oldenlandia corymbosa var. corymbosa]|uniref:OLC1v1024403C1 n=1 Tax=Oldenlandia corymbosa var. corymbosa TaxID=529605 RepID=A0AAV1C526_OLDCO|nr:OLC1v1024403C1 [Oldenlandia corymbosa var. corymbosa]
MLDNMFINLTLENIGEYHRVSKAWEQMTKRQEFVLKKREMSYPATENNILVFTQTSQEGHLLQDKLIVTNIKVQMDNPCNHIRLQEEMSMGDDGIHKIMSGTIDLVCLQTRSQIKFLNPKTTQLALIEWPYDVHLSNCEKAFGGLCVIDEYHITQNHHCQMWAWDPDTSTWDCMFETHESPNVNTHAPHGLQFRHDWLYPVFLSHKSSPVGQFIVKGYDNRHLMLYSVPTRKITQVHRRI